METISEDLEGQTNQEGEKATIILDSIESTVYLNQILNQLNKIRISG
jgi:hypothetical protein